MKQAKLQRPLLISVEKSHPGATEAEDSAGQQVSTTREGSQTPAMCPNNSYESYERWRSTDPRWLPEPRIP